MSCFVLRQGKPQMGDIATDPERNIDVTLVDQIMTESGDDSYWIAKDPEDKLIIVNDWNLIDIGYYE